MTQTVATQVPTQAPGAKLDKQTKRRIILASTVGTTIEFYDFYAYATAAVTVV